jgi:hypothetical protein
VNLASSVVVTIERAEYNAESLKLTKKISFEPTSANFLAGWLATPAKLLADTMSPRARPVALVRLTTTPLLLRISEG